MAPQPAPQPEQDALWHLNIDLQQQALLDTLREELSARAALVPSLDDDLSLLRFLKARHWDLRKATDMYQNMANWRWAQGIDDTLRTFRFPERAAVRCVYPHFYHKTDCYGRPVYYERTGRVDFERLMSVTTHERFLTYHISLAETFRQHKLAACSAIAGRPVLGLVVVLDLEGFTLREFAAARELLTEMTCIDQSYFPEHLGAMFIVNAPVLFRSAWACVKPFLDPRTLGKIKVLGSNYRPELLALIPEENLPVRYGGASAANEMEDEGPWSDWTGLPSGLPASPRCGSPPAAAPLARLPSAALSGEMLETGAALAAALPCSAAASAVACGASAAVVAAGGGAAAAAEGEAPLSLVAIGSRRSSRTSSRGSSPGLGLLITPQAPAGPFASGEVGAENATAAAAAAATAARQPRASLLGDTIQEEPLGGERAGSGSSEGTARAASLLDSWPAAAAEGGAAAASAAGALRRPSSTGGQLLSPTASGALAGALAGKLAIGERAAASGDGALLSPRGNA